MSTVLMLYRSSFDVTMFPDGRVLSDVLFPPHFVSYDSGDDALSEICS